MIESNAITIIRLRGVSKTFSVSEQLAKGYLGKVSHALGLTKVKKIVVLRNVDLDIKKGEFIGIIGKNGSGKSTLMHLISGAIRPDKGGKVKREGSFIRLSLGMGFNPELTARQNVFLNASILGVPLKEIKKNYAQIIAFAELENFADTQLKYFSAGMRARLAFAVAVLIETDVLLMDEFFGGVGDESFKRKAHQVFKESMLKDKTVVLISHSMQTIEKYCNRVFLVSNGNVRCFDDPKEAIKIYRNENGGTVNELPSQQLFEP